MTDVDSEAAGAEPRADHAGERLEVVHRAAPEVADEFVMRLQEAELDAIALDRPGVLVLLVTFGTYRVRIAVPSSQVERARAVMDEWDRAAAPRVRELTRSVRRQVFLAALPAVVACVPILALVRGWDLLPWFACALPALFLLTFLALSIRERGRAARGR